MTDSEPLGAANGAPSAASGSRIAIVPIDRAPAQAFVAQHHRHHRPPPGAVFQLAAAIDGEIVGVAIVGRPVARMFCDGWTLEVNRTCTDGSPNVNSALYGAAWRATKALGYRRLITYTQQGETGASLRAAGWRVVAERPPTKGWDRPSRPRVLRGNELIQRTLWEAS